MQSSEELYSLEQLKTIIRTVPDFPSAGIQFKDITPLLADPKALRTTIKSIANHFRNQHIDYVAGMEARGFIVGTPLALELGCGFIMIRKPSKLPGEKVTVGYDKEYGKDVLEISATVLKGGEKVLVVDDLIATGGTALAACHLIEKAGGVVTGTAFIAELAELPGRRKLEEAGKSVYSLMIFELPPNDKEREGVLVRE
jgi:adenine phosphoribosyltransferase